MKKYCIDIMGRKSSGRFRLVGREYLDPDDKEFQQVKKNGVESLVKSWLKQGDVESGEYVVTLFREKRKRNGAIKSKKKISGYRFAV